MVLVQISLPFNWQWLNTVTDVCDSDNDYMGYLTHYLLRATALILINLT